MPRHSFYLAVDASGHPRVTKRMPDVGWREYRWRVNVTLPDPPPLQTVELDVADAGTADLAVEPPSEPEAPES